MTTLTITLDEATEAGLHQLSTQEGRQPSEYVARLVARTVRAARPRRAFDPELIRAYTKENRDEEEALADSDSAHRAELLAQEDKA